MNNQKLLVGLFAGVAVGAALGILFAPEKGSEIRKKIKEKGTGYKQDFTDKFGNIVDTATQTMDTVKSKINDYTGKSAATDSMTSTPGKTDSRATV